MEKDIDDIKSEIGNIKSEIMNVNTKLIAMKTKFELQFQLLFENLGIKDYST